MSKFTTIKFEKFKLKCKTLEFEELELKMGP